MREDLDKDLGLTDLFLIEENDVWDEQKYVIIIVTLKTCSRKK